MSGFPSYTSFDYQPVATIPVIASFDAEGPIAPLYVRVDGVPLKVDSFWVKSSFAHTVTFSCQVQHEDTLLPVLLSYYQTEGVWTIPAQTQSLLP